LAQDLDYIKVAQEEGAALAWGGQPMERSSRNARGYYLQPALFVETSNDMRISREEVFGPLANVIRARGYDEALELANDTDLACLPAFAPGR